MPRTNRSIRLLALVFVVIVLLPYLPPVSVAAMPPAPTTAAPDTQAQVTPPLPTRTGLPGELAASTTSVSDSSTSSDSPDVCPALTNAHRLFLPLLARARENLSLNVTISATTASTTTVTAGRPDLTLTVEVRDANGAVATNYRGQIQLTASTPTTGLPRQYTFTAEDRGRHVFTDWGFDVDGQQNITVSVGGVSVTTRRIEVVAPQQAFPVPPTIQAPPPLPYGWFPPFVATGSGGANSWQYDLPNYDVPASAGVAAIVTGVTQKVAGRGA